MTMDFDKEFTRGTGTNWYKEFNDIVVMIWAGEDAYSDPEKDLPKLNDYFGFEVAFYKVDPIEKPPRLGEPLQVSDLTGGLLNEFHGRSRGGTWKPGLHMERIPKVTLEAWMKDLGYNSSGAKETKSIYVPYSRPIKTKKHVIDFDTKFKKLLSEDNNKNLEGYYGVVDNRFVVYLVVGTSSGTEYSYPAVAQKSGNDYTLVSFYVRHLGNPSNGGWYDWRTGGANLLKDKEYEQLGLLEFLPKATLKGGIFMRNSVGNVERAIMRMEGVPQHRLDGRFCRACAEFYPYAVEDGKDGRLLCWNCKNE